VIKNQLAHFFCFVLLNERLLETQRKRVVSFHIVIHLVCDVHASEKDYIYSMWLWATKPVTCRTGKCVAIHCMCQNDWFFFYAKHH